MPLIALLALGPLVIYVSDKGNDGWTGAAGKPFRTLERAAKELLRLHDTDRGRPAEVLLRGTFTLTLPLTIGAEACTTTFRSWDSRHLAVISGGIKLDNWKQAPGPHGLVWVAAVPQTVHYRQFWAGGTRRMPIAALRDLRLAGLLPEDKNASWSAGDAAAKFNPADVPAIAHPQDVEFIACHRWAESRMGLRDLDRTNGVFHFDRKSTFQLTDGDGQPSPYRLENVAEAMGKGGDWCYDRANSRLLADTSVRPAGVVSNCPNLIVVRGAAKVAFENIVFRHTEWEPPTDNAGDGQAAISVPAALTLDGCSSSTITRCRFEHIGTYAVEIRGPSANNTIDGCQMTDLGAGGVKIGPLSGGTLLENCRMEGMGKIFASAVGVWIGDSGHNVVRHNTIRDLYYTGVSVGWTWGYGVSHAVENVIEANDISVVGQGRLSDMGGIYTLGVSPGTVLRGNRIQNVESRTYGGWGIYLDEGSSNILVEDNLVSDAKTGSFHQHYGQDNLIRNNVFLLARLDGQLIRTRKENHRSFTMEQNVVVWRDAPLLGSNWDGGIDIDRNVYWRTDGKPVTFAGKSIEDWRAMGHDQESVIADPMMRVSDRGVRFGADSPALRLGIHPIDMSRVGELR